jgi:ABC-type iron transport system FetAB permease component
LTIFSPAWTSFSTASRNGAVRERRSPPGFLGGAVGLHADRGAVDPGVHRALLVAALRMIVQLVALGYVLRWIFAVDQAWITLGAIIVMTLAARREAGARSGVRLRRGHFAISLTALGLPTLLTCLFALATMLRPEPLWSPRYAIPMTGILLGNVLTSVSLTLEGMLAGAKAQAASIKARLILGHAVREATATLPLRAGSFDENRNIKRRSQYHVFHTMVNGDETVLYKFAEFT